MIVCHCRHVSDRTIARAIADGVTTVSQLTAQTQAGRDCGTCINVLQHHLENNGNDGPPGKSSARRGEPTAPAGDPGDPEPHDNPGEPQQNASEADGGVARTGATRATRFTGAAWLHRAGNLLRRPCPRCRNQPRWEKHTPEGHRIIPHTCLRCGNRNQLFDETAQNIQQPPDAWPATTTITLVDTGDHTRQGDRTNPQ